MANNIIDAYDINYVASKLDGGIIPTKDKNIAGEIMLSPSKTNISAGETFTVDIIGTNLSDVNGFSVEIPLDSVLFKDKKGSIIVVNKEKILQIYDVYDDERIG